MTTLFELKDALMELSPNKFLLMPGHLPSNGRYKYVDESQLIKLYGLSSKCIATTFNNQKEEIEQGRLIPLYPCSSETYDIHPLLIKLLPLPPAFDFSSIETKDLAKFRVRLESFHASRHDYVCSHVDYVQFRLIAHKALDGKTAVEWVKENMFSRLLSAGCYKFNLELNRREGKEYRNNWVRVLSNQIVGILKDRQ